MEAFILSFPFLCTPDLKATDASPGASFSMDIAFPYFSGLCERSWLKERFPGQHPGEALCSLGDVPMGSTCPAVLTVGDRQLGPILQA
jgi:hypothetical protein